MGGLSQTNLGRIQQCARRIGTSPSPLIQLLLDNTTRCHMVVVQDANFDPDLNDRLCDATWDGDVEQVNEFLRIGADPNYHEESGYSPLLLAVEQGHLELAEILLANGADVNLRGAQGTWSPLIHAVETASVVAIELGRRPDNRMIQLLLAHGADVHALSSHGGTAMDSAREYGNHEAEAMLLAAARRGT